MVTYQVLSSYMRLLIKLNIFDVALKPLLINNIRCKKG